MDVIVRARPLVPGPASGEALVLEAPLSLWGGLDPETGLIVDRRHPQAGATVTGRILAMVSGRGSSSSSNVLAEAVRLGTAPAGIVLRDADPILVVGSLVAQDLYGRVTPIVVIDAAGYASIRTGDRVDLAADGRAVRISALRASGAPSPR